MLLLGSNKTVSQSTLVLYLPACSRFLQSLSDSQFCSIYPHPRALTTLSQSPQHRKDLSAPGLLMGMAR